MSGIYTYSFATIGSCNVISATIDLTNNTLPAIYAITDFRKCDDNLDGNDTNSFVDFDLTSKKTEILGTQTGINITYYTLQSDAELGQNNISTIYTNSRTIYVRLTNTSTRCYAINSFNLLVNPIPVVNVITNIQCDDDNDGYTDLWICK